MNLLNLAAKAAKHLDTADKLLATAQHHADKHLAGTDLHKKLTGKIAMAQGHVGTAKTFHGKLQSITKQGGKRRRSKRTTRPRKSSSTSKRRRTTKRKNRRR